MTLKREERRLDVEALRGKTVRFTATLSRGNDAHFAFAKRPTKAEVI